MIGLQQLQQLVSRCTDPAGVSFYRKLYGITDSEGALQVASLEQWRSLPTFSKKEITDTPLAERTFVPHSEVNSIETTSGTSGKPPTFIPWVLQNEGYNYRPELFDFKKASLSSLAASLQQEWILQQYPTASTLVVLDPKHPAWTVSLARTAGVDSLLVYLHHVLILAEEMKKQGLAEHIRFIEYYGETCTRKSLQYMHDAFPNALICAEYSSMDVEANPIGVLCLPHKNEGPLETYHPARHNYLEIIDTETGAPLPIQKGVEGDLVVTAGFTSQAAFPLIRYRIGDTIRVIEEKCESHDAWSFEIVGRTEMDFIRIPGGMLRVDEIIRVLKSIGNATPDDFQMHVGERVSKKGPVLHATLHLSGVEERSLSRTAETIERFLRVGPTSTYRDGVEKGIYDHLECAVLEKPAQKLTKRKRMLRV